MPKKYQKRRQKFPWPLIVFGVLLLISAAILYINRKGQDVVGTASIAVDPELIDFGDVKLDDSRTFTFSVMNRGNGTLRFNEQPYIEILEGC